MIRHALATALVAVAIGTTAALLPGSPAAAAPACTSQPVNNSDAGWGEVKAASPLRRAPYGHCGVVTTLSENTRVYFHCYAQNDYGNIWIWARKAGTETYGWIWVEDIKSYGGDPNIGWCPGEPS